MSKVRGMSTERIAKHILEKLGYKIIEQNKIFEIDDVEVAEIDFVVEDKNGERFIVEAKSGDVDVGTIRNVYANAKTLNMKPLIIARKFANLAAEKLAKKLNVKVLFLNEYFLLLDAVELEVLLRGAVVDALRDYSIRPFTMYLLSDDEKQFLEALLDSENVEDLMNKLNITKTDFAKMISKLKKKDVLPKHSLKYNQLKEHVRLVLFWANLLQKLENIEKQLEIITKKMLKNEQK